MECKLCGGYAVKIFNLVVLDKYQGEYCRCSDCECLQVVEPSWLGEAYSSGNLSGLDYGVMQRNLDNFCIVYFFSRILAVNTILDYGGGVGVLTRLLRDYSLNSRFYDIHVTHSLAPSFNVSELANSDLFLAFEVLEHFSDPSKELFPLFAASPKYLIVSTEIYDNQGESWPYLVPQTGQHVFFYSEKGMRFIAAKYGYKYLRVSGYGLFYRAARRIVLIEFVFTFAVAAKRYLRLLFFFLSPKGVQVDVRNT